MPVAVVPVLLMRLATIGKAMPAATYTTNDSVPPIVSTLTAPEAATLIALQGPPDRSVLSLGVTAIPSWAGDVDDLELIIFSQCINNQCGSH